MMTPETVLSFKPNVTREEAVRAFTDRSGRWRLNGPLRSVAELYVPFTLFQVTIQHGNTHDVRLLAIDRFCGELDPFIFGEKPRPDETACFVSRNRLDVLLSQAQAEAALTTRLQRMLFQKGFFRVRNLSLRMVAVGDFYMPYWVGFFGFGTRPALKIIDATRRVFEGNKLRSGVEQWLSS